MDVTILLSKAHAEFRRLRSGELADNLRAQGVEYRTIWGVESYRLKEIAARLLADNPMSHDEQTAWAKALWQEDVRESKLLATRLCPIDAMDDTMARAWASDIRYTEVADQACMNLFARLLHAEALATEWIEEASAMKRYLALQIATRRDMEPLRDKASAIANDTTQPLWLRTAAQRAVQSLDAEALCPTYRPKPQASKSKRKQQE